MRLKECGLTTLETRRLRGDQIEVFKILNGYENIDRNIFFTVKEERRTKGHGVTLAKKQCRLDIRKFSFSQRTVNEWTIFIVIFGIKTNGQRLTLLYCAASCTMLCAMHMDKPRTYKRTLMSHRPLCPYTTVYLCVYVKAKHAIANADLQGKKKKKKTEESGSPISLRSTISPSWNLTSPYWRVWRIVVTSH